MCADPRMPVATEACCGFDDNGDVDTAARACRYLGERLTYEDAQLRCASVGYGDSCDAARMRGRDGE